MNPLQRLIRNLDHPGLPLEAAVLAGCLLAALCFCWLVGRRRGPESVWFGRAIVDGLLFPLLALGLVYVAARLLVSHQPAMLLRVAVPVLLSLAGIRFIARVLAVAFPESRLARSTERLFSWVAWILVVLWLVGVLPQLREELDKFHFAFGKSRVSVLDILDGALSAGAVMIAALWVSAAVEKQVLRPAVQDLSLRKVASNAVRASLLVVGVLVALSATGIDLTALSVLGGALGVGLGFGLQKLAANYVSGFVILFERSFRIGDVVRVDGFEGKVMDIKTRYTLIRSPGGRESIVPNEKLITERIENLSLADPKVLLTTDVSVGYDSDVSVVERVLLDAARRSDLVLAEPEPAVRLLQFGADGLQFQLLFWIAEPARGPAVKSQVNLAILAGLREHGIDIPYPQRVVHVRGEPLSASGTAATG